MGGAGSLTTAASAELDVMRRLRAVLKRSSRGLGLAAAFVAAFSRSRDGDERLAVKRILLGMPLEKAFAGLGKSAGTPGELLRFVSALGRMSSLEASRGAARLSPMFDRWTLLKERQEMEKRVMAFRGVVVSAVAGVVVGMLSSLAPALSSFQITLGTTQQPPSGFSPYEGALFLLPSALALGFFLSPRRPYLNAAVSLLAFAGVVYFVGPLLSFGLGG